MLQKGNLQRLLRPRMDHANKVLYGLGCVVMVHFWVHIPMGWNKWGGVRCASKEMFH